ncbi:hypothetical protein A0H76_2872 [Hepatospora eriocheir]|uniref:Uncharacterized protein n=1 Tax=Hepatospora eriocheir TaxID=1081669 RepID=A0A1X0Q5B1_9MICR|nr:hypothetical protein A0H76_2872 [Hepatospora eriocheir]
MKTKVNLIKKYYKIITVVIVVTGLLLLIVITGILLNNPFDKRNVESKETDVISENVDIECKETYFTSEETEFESNDNSDYKTFMVLLNNYCKDMVTKITPLKNNWYKFNKNEKEKIFKDNSYIKSKKNKNNFVRNLDNFIMELELIKGTKKEFDRKIDNFMNSTDSKSCDKIYEEKKSLDETFLFHIRKFEKESYGFSLKLLTFFVDEN